MEETVRSASFLSRLRPRRLWLALFGLVTAIGLYAGYQVATGNFHAVVPGEVYRSAQPSPEDLEAWVARYGIRTVVTLRGENAGQAWYDEEKAAAERLKLNFVHFGMRAREDLSLDRMKELVAILRDAPKPILIHCNSGADRSGLAAALYLAAVKSRGPAEAGRELWPIYGHLPLVINEAAAMDRSFAAMMRELQRPGP